MVQVLPAARRLLEHLDQPGIAVRQQARRQPHGRARGLASGGMASRGRQGAGLRPCRDRGEPGAEAAQVIMNQDDERPGFAVAGDQLGDDVA